MRQLFLRLPLLGLLVLATAPCARAATTYYVDGVNGNDNSPGTQSQPRKTLHAGLDLVHPGDTVLVADATYSGPGNVNLLIAINNAAITLKSINGPAHCILDQQGGGVAFLIKTIGSSASSLTIDGFTITNGTGASYNSKPVGGAVAVDTVNFPVTLNNCVFTNGTAAWGGGVAVINCTGLVTISNCAFTSNTAKTTADSAAASGGGLFLGASPAVVSNCTFSNNIAQASGSNSNAVGGAIYIQNCSPAFTNCTTDSNVAAASGGNAGGGGLHLDMGGSPTLTNCHMDNNLAFTSAAGKAAEGGGLYLGAPYLGAATVTLTGGSVSGNSVLSGQNILDGQGGGIFSVLVNLNCRNVVFSGNLIDASGEVEGGGVFLYETLGTLINCTFADNQVQCLAGTTNVLGGGLSSTSGEIHLTGCIFRGNQLLGEGGTNVLGAAAFLSGGFDASFLIDCLCFGNTIQGGASQFGGGLFTQGFIGSITNCTITGNAARDGGAGVALNTGSNPTLGNTIIYNNSPSSDFAAYNGAAPTVTCCDIKGGYTGTGNINANPLFYSLSNSDFRLQQISPCVNAGSASVPNFPATDLLGNPRNVGGAPDMGVYERQGPSPTALYVDKNFVSLDPADGTPAHPFPTVGQALALAGDPSVLATIYIRAGYFNTSYNERPRITQHVRLANWGNAGQASIGKP
jgi:hypothetical protein